MSYTAPAGVLIGSIQAYATDWGFMDNFQFYQLYGFELQDAPSVQTISGEEFGVHYGTSGNDVFSLTDVSGFANSEGGTSLFTGDGYMQMMVKGNTGDTVNLDDLMADGSDPGNWANNGQVSVTGVVYEVYRHDALDAELLVQQRVQTNLV